jgi:hypothetical protein
MWRLAWLDHEVRGSPMIADSLLSPGPRSAAGHGAGPESADADRSLPQGLAASSVCASTWIVATAARASGSSLRPGRRLPIPFAARIFELGRDGKKNILISRSWLGFRFGDLADERLATPNRLIDPGCDRLDNREFAVGPADYLRDLPVVREGRRPTRHDRLSTAQQPAEPIVTRAKGASRPSPLCA